MRAAMLFALAAFVSRSTASSQEDCQVDRPHLCQTLKEHTKENSGSYDFYLRYLKCDKHGNFEQRQCKGSDGPCWCVDPFTGVPSGRGNTGAHSLQCGRKRCSETRWGAIYSLPFIRATCDLTCLFQYEEGQWCKYYC